MAVQSIKTNPPNGRFVKGVSGNPSGRPKGSTNHNAELRRLEEDAQELAANVADVINEAARLALVEVAHPELIPLFNAIIEAAKDAVKTGKIGPSSVALIRNWHEDHLEGHQAGAFFTHAGLPSDCSREAFRDHYTHRGRIDHARHAGDLVSYPPVAQRIKSLIEEAA